MQSFRLTLSKIWYGIVVLTCSIIIGGLGFLTYIVTSDQGRQSLAKLINKHAQTSTVQFKIDKITCIHPLTVQFIFIQYDDKNEIKTILKNAALKLEAKQLFPIPVLKGSLIIDQSTINYTPPSSLQNDLPKNDVPFDKETLSLKIKTLQDNIARYKLPCPLSIVINCPHIVVLSPSNILSPPFGSQVSFSGQFSIVSTTQRDFTSALNLQGDFGKLHLGASGLFRQFNFGLKASLTQFMIKQHEVSNFAASVKLIDLPHNPVLWTALNFTTHQVDNALTLTGQFNASFTALSGKLKFNGFDTIIGAAGKYNFRTDDINSAIVFDVKNLASVSQFADLDLTGRCQGTGHIYKKDKQLNVSITGQAADLKYQDIVISKANVDTALTGILKQPTGKIAVNVEGAQYQDYHFNNAKVSATLKQGKGPLDLTVQGDPLSFKIGSMLDVQPDQQTLVLRQLDLNYDQYPVKLLKGAVFKHDDQSYSLSPLTVNILNVPLTFAGSIENEILNGTIKGQLNLKFIERAFLANGDRLKGKVDMKLKAQGPINQPILNGDFALESGSYENFQYGILFKNINLLAQLKNNIILVTRGSASDLATGQLKLSGQYDITNNTADLKLNLTNFFIARSDALTLFVSQSAIKAAGSLREISITGDINLVKSFVNIAYTITNDVPTLNIIDPRKPSPPPQNSDDNNFFENSVLGIMINLTTPLRVYGRGLESVWTGSIKISQSLNDPKLKGQLNLKQGHLSFLGQKLKLSHGTVLFDGLEKNVPYLDIQATLDRSDFTAEISMMGRTDRLKFNLSSSPAMEQDEILAYILFGKEPGHLSPLQAIQLGRALISLQRGEKGDSLLDTLKSSLGLNQLFSSGNEDDEDSSLNPVGKLLDRVNISFDQGVGPEDTKVTMELKLTKRITIETAASPGPSGESVSINYKKIY